MTGNQWPLSTKSGPTCSSEKSEWGIKTEDYNSVKGLGRKWWCVCRSVARDKLTLACLGVTHIVNAAAGKHRINTGPQFYSDLEVKYFAVEAADHPEFNLQPFFSPTAQFIDSALNDNGI